MGALATSALAALSAAASLAALARRGTRADPLRAALAGALLFALASCALEGPASLLLCAALGAAALWVRDGRPAAAAQGLAAGAIFYALGRGESRWLELAAALSTQRSFAGDFIRWTAPVLLAASLPGTAMALRHPDFSASRKRVLLALWLAWALPPELALWRLKAAYGWGPRTLGEAAALPEPSDAESLALVWLKSDDRGRAVRWERRRAACEGVDVSVESLQKLYLYLRDVQFRSLFAGQALRVLRCGWAFWWEPDRELMADLLSASGAAPDYRAALALIQAGPQTLERFQKLQALAAAARSRREGFEDVNRSQLIFEGFASAYARFGEESEAKRWLLRIDNLWPIYEKKVEVAPLEALHEGKIGGTLLLDGIPATSIKVGLFWIPSSTAEARGEWALSQSDFPDARGRFEFPYLAPGRYFLGLLGYPSQLRGKVLGSPGIIEVSEESPTRLLAPIRVERRLLPGF